ncbi:MAG: glycosyltransferase family 9 protein [Candidatus Omnitrophota bacterium]
MRRSKEYISKGRKENLKILLINPFGIGDMLFSTPLIEILKERYPGASLSYICNKRTLDALEKCPSLENVFVFEKGDYKELWKSDKRRFLREFVRFVRKVRNEKFDIAIDMSMGHQYGLFLKLMRVPERVGFDYKGRGRFHTKRLAFDGFTDKPIGEYYKDLLLLAGLGSGDKRIKIWWTEEDAGYIQKFFDDNKLDRADTIIGIAPGGGVSFGKEKISFKRWPHEKFAQLADRIIEKIGAKVIFIWGPGEEGLIKDILGLMQMAPIVAPKTSIRQMAALMSMCDCVVSNDAGPLHVAVAAGSRTVSIFGPSDQRVYGPYPVNERNITVTKGIECRPCYKKFRVPDCKTLECLNKLEVEDVFIAVADQVKVLKSDVETKR